MKTTKQIIIAARSVSIAILSQLLLLTSCQQNDELQRNPSQGVPLRLTSGISTVQTRAFDSSWENTDEIGVFTVTTGGTSASNITYSGTQRDENIKYKIDGDVFSGASTSIETYDGSNYDFKSFVPQGNQIYLPANGSDVDVYAYYPWTMGVTASAPLSIAIPTTQTIANQKTADVLTAKATASTDKKPDPATDYYPINIDHTTAQLTFSHIMSKVLVRVVVGEGYGANDLSGTNISSVVLSGQPTAATFAPVTQTLTITAGSDNVTMAELASTDVDYVSKATVALTENATPTEQDVIHNYRAIILPNTGTTGTNPVTNGTQRQINFNVGSITYSYNITQNFQPGYQTVFTIILAANEVTVSAAITPWTANLVQPDKPLIPDP